MPRPLQSISHSSHYGWVQLWYDTVAASYALAEGPGRGPQHEHIHVKHEQDWLWHEQEEYCCMNRSRYNMNGSIYDMNGSTYSMNKLESVWHELKYVQHEQESIRHKQEYVQLALQTSHTGCVYHSCSLTHLPFSNFNTVRTLGNNCNMQNVLAF